MKAKRTSVIKKSGLMLFVAACTLVNTISAEQLLATWPIDLSDTYWIGTGFSNPIDEELSGFLQLILADDYITLWSSSLTKDDIGNTFPVNSDNLKNILTDGTNSVFLCHAANLDQTDANISDTEANIFGSSPHSSNGIDFPGYTITSIRFTLEHFSSHRWSSLHHYDPPDISYDWYSSIAVTGTFSFYGEPNLKIHTAVELEWPAVSGLVYQIQWNTNLATNVWHNLGDSIIGDGTTNRVFDSTQHTPQKFYRIIIQ